MTALTAMERRILALESRGYSDEEIALDYRTYRFTPEKVREIKAAAKAKRSAPNNGDAWWNK